MHGVVPAFFNYFLKITGPIAAVAFISAVLGNLVQVGFLFTVKPLKPDLKADTSELLENLLSGHFFLGGSFFNLAKSLVKIAVIRSIAYFNIRMELDKIAHFFTTPIWLSIVTISKTAFRILVESAVAMLVISITGLSLSSGNSTGIPSK